MRKSVDLVDACVRPASGFWYFYVTGRLSFARKKLTRSEIHRCKLGDFPLVELRCVQSAFFFVVVFLLHSCCFLHFITMNVIRSTGNGRQVEANSVVMTAGLRTRTVSSGVSGSLGSSDGRLVDEEMAVIAAPPEVAMFSTAEEMAPAEIPPEPSGTEYADGDEDEDDDDLDNHDRDNRTRNIISHTNHEDEDDEESEYEYEEDDDAAFSGFLMTGQPLQLATNTVSLSVAEPARIREDDDDDEELEYSEASPMEHEESPTNSDQINQQPSLAAAAVSRKSKWREPSRDAVNMSLRAERETTGGKRRLAQDLYRIMNQDTEEAGFSLQPKSEDAMDKWTIKLFQFDEDSNLAKDMMVLGLDHIELEMSFPEHYPFDPPFVRVVRPRFKRQTGFVMNGALCMELLTKDGWNPVNDIESVIVSIRSLLVVGDGRLQAACDMPKPKYEGLLAAAKKAAPNVEIDLKDATRKRQRSESGEQLLSRREKDDADDQNKKESHTNKKLEDPKKISPAASEPAGAYSMAEAMAAYTHLSDYHAKKGWDNSGWWTRKG